MSSELHAASAFSFLDGGSQPETLIERAAQLGMPALALGDRNGLYGAARFHTAAVRCGVRAHIGAEIAVRSFGNMLTPPAWLPHQHPSQPPRLLLLCESQTGYQNLCQLITRFKMRETTKAEGAATLDDIEEFSAGLICLTGGDEGPLAAALAQGGSDAACKIIDRLKAIFGPRISISNCSATAARPGVPQPGAACARLLAAAAGDCHQRRSLCNGSRPRAARCTHCHSQPHHARQGRPPAGCQRAALVALWPRDGCALPRHSRSHRQHAHREPAARLHAQQSRLRVPALSRARGETMDSFLAKRVDEGVRKRYGNPAKQHLLEKAKAQVQHELKLIAKLGFAGYFLIVWDLIRYCQQHGILVQGRGSAANSAVCYALEITAVDPVGMELLFERFLSESRGEWPDIDLDLPSGDEREQVIQYCYERYGALGAAMTANVITYRGRSAAREVGKALGFEEETVTRLSSLVGHWEWRGDNDTLARNFDQAGFDIRHPRIARYLDLCLRMHDLPRHLGQHSGGMVVCAGMLNRVVPIERASMPGRTVVQWDKEDCADLGLIKVDLLGLGMMAVLKESHRADPAPLQKRSGPRHAA